VRVGNGAADQLQLDVYGEVIDAVAQLARLGVPLDRETEGMLRGFGRIVCEGWRRPGHSLWEMRAPARAYTHARLLSWVALDRLIELHARGAIRRGPVDPLREQHHLLERELEERAWNPEVGAYTQALDDRTVDASSLLVGWYGFAEVRSARMQSTYRAVREKLRAGPGLVYRYEQSRADGEGAFAICSFWVAEHLSRGGGSLDEARQFLARALLYINDVGLLAEEIDPRTGEALGNVPQAYSHVGLINAVLSLAVRERDEGRRPGVRLGTEVAVPEVRT
jgi:GH15 family glucan-1,4-alpha-glucosidase